MGVRLASFVIWAAVAASAVFWGLRLGGASPSAPAHASVAAQDLPIGGADLTRLFGVPPPPPPVAAAPAAPPPPQDSRFKLLGVVAQRRASPSAGLALISLDGQAAKAYGQGAVVDGSTVVLAVRHRQVELGPRGGPVQLRLELAALPAAARGNLAGLGAPGQPVPGQPMPPVAMPSVPVGSPMAPRLVPPPTTVQVPPPPMQMIEAQGDGGIPVQGMAPPQPGAMTR